MYGITNSQNIIQSGGDGDSVYAVNNTGADITAGQKVWLNKHNLDESESEFSQRNGDFRNKTYFIFDSNNNFSSLSLNYRYKWAYNTDDKTWTVSENPYAGGMGGACLLYHNNDYYATLMNSWTTNTSLYNFICNETVFENDKSGYKINDTYKVVYVSSYTYNLINSTDESIIYTFNFSGVKSYIYTIIYKKNKLLIITGNNTGNNVYWYSINLEQDYVVPDFVPTVTPLAELDNSVVRTKNIILYYTGLENGDYLFTSQNDRSSGGETSTLYVYKIVNNDIISATDLQADLQALVGQSCYIFYDDRVKRLYVSTSDYKIYMFTWKSGEFINENITINPLDYITPYGYGISFAISDDMTTAALQGWYSSSNGMIIALKRKTTSDDWFAENFAQCSSLSLTGIATGNTDEQGRYEVSTVLGES